jgi:formylglycine-generating enzyme required for sulfatase activity
MLGVVLYAQEFRNCDFNNASLSFEADGNDFIECDFRNAQITVLCCPGSVRFIDCIMPDGSKYTGDGEKFLELSQSNVAPGGGDDGGNDDGGEIPVVPTPTEDPFTVPELDLEMMPIPAGTFLMGVSGFIFGQDDGEGPQTTVTITKPFWLGKTEVTQAQWKIVMGSGPSGFKGSDLPMTHINWHDAVAFGEKLNEMKRDTLPAGYHYTLPTEAQWEYACRAGTTTRFYFGDDPGYSQLGQYAWYSDNSSGKKHPVGKKLPNEWGLYDMHGNVGEWCLDRHDYYLGGSVSDPQGPQSGFWRVIRGGGWSYPAYNCTSTFRDMDTPDAWFGLLGFRVALSPVPSE